MTDHLIYFAVTLSGLAAVAGVLVTIGRVAARCREAAGAARLGTWVVTTAFLAIGAGAIALIGAAMPVIADGGLSALYLVIGLALVTIGIGFQIAASTLRDIIAAAPRAPEA